MTSMIQLDTEAGPSISLEHAMELNPVGYFHYRLLLMCGLAFMSDALEVTMLSFLTTCVAVEWNLSGEERSTLTAMVFLGIVFGSVFWGWIADKYGRRPAYMYACIVISVGGLFSALAPSYAILTILRAITGFGIGGATVPFDLLAEFMPSTHRGRFLSLTMIFWTIGSMFIAGVAWIVLPTMGWRALVLIGAAPVLLVTVLSYFYLPESPRWLLSKHRERDASAVVRASALVNDVVLPDFVISSDFSKTAKEVSYWDLISTTEARKLTIPLWLIWGLFGFTYYGLIIFVSRIYSNIDSSDSSNENTEGGELVCKFDYGPIFYNASSEGLAVLINTVLVDRLGRKFAQTLFYSIGGFALIMLPLHSESSWALSFSIIARICAMSSSVRKSTTHRICVIN